MSSVRYELILRQQPKHSRMCGFGEKVDRRPIDPPPIIQMLVHGEDDATTQLESPYYFMYACILATGSETELHLLRDGKTRSTAGSIVSSLYKLRDTDRVEGRFFVFPDLSVRMEGTYRLKFTMFKIIDCEIRFCASIISNNYNVYPAKKFPGMEGSTALSRCFAEQGLKIRIRKDVRTRTTKKVITDTGKAKKRKMDDFESDAKEDIDIKLKGDHNYSSVGSKPNVFPPQYSNSQSVYPYYDGTVDKNKVRPKSQAVGVRPPRTPMDYAPVRPPPPGYPYYYARPPIMPPGTYGEYSEMHYPPGYYPPYRGYGSQPPIGNLEKGTRPPAPVHFPPPMNYYYPGQLPPSRGNGTTESPYGNERPPPGYQTPDYSHQTGQFKKGNDARRTIDPHPVHPYLPIPPYPYYGYPFRPATDRYHPPDRNSGSRSSTPSSVYNKDPPTPTEKDRATRKESIRHENLDIRQTLSSNEERRSDPAERRKSSDPTQPEQYGYYGYPPPPHYPPRNYYWYGAYVGYPPTASNASPTGEKPLAEKGDNEGRYMKTRKK